MSKHRSSTRSARVDAILRYRSASEGVLCSTRCRELSPTGLTASIERPVFQGELLRFDLEPPTGGPSVLGLARVAWTGGDPDGAPGALLMRMRFISLGEASESALLEWLEEIGDISERRSSPEDDSSVRALSRAIADSLLPPPPVLPGAVPSTESSGLSPSPVTVPNRRSIPPPPGMYTRSTRTLSHPVDHVGAIKAALVPVAPAPAPEAAATKSRALREAPASRRTADVRERLSRLQSRRDNTPLVVYTQTAELDAAVRAERVSSSPRAASPSSAPVARVTLAAPLPLGALLNAPPETTRRSSPPPPGQLSEASEGSVSSSWAALRVPASVAAVALPELDASPPPATQRVSRATIPPPPHIEEMPPLRVSQPPIEGPAERASLPIEGPSLPLSDAPWSVPAPPPGARGARPWVALCVGSVAVGAAIAYLVYGPALASRIPRTAAMRPPSQAAPGSITSAAADAPSAAAGVPGAPHDADESLKHWIGLPKERGIDELDVAEAPTAAPAPAARLAPTPVPSAPIEPPKPIAAIKPALAEVPPPASLVAAGSAAAPPPPALPSVLASPLERARACVARGDSACALDLLKDATSEPEVALWIETLRAAGRAPEARAAMQRYIETFPDSQRATTYRRILNNAP